MITVHMAAEWTRPRKKERQEKYDLASWARAGRISGGTSLL